MKIGLVDIDGYILFFATTGSGTRTRLCRTPEEAKKLAEEIEAAEMGAVSDRRKRSIEREQYYLHREMRREEEGDWIAVESVEGYFILVKPSGGGSSIFLVFRRDRSPVPGRYATLAKAIAAAVADQAYGEDLGTTPGGP